MFQSKPNQRSLVRNCEHYLETMMSEETTTGPNVMPGDLITRPGLYESRGGDIMRIIGWGEGWWVSEWDGKRDWYGSDGRQRFDGGLEPNWWQLLRWVGPLPASEVEPETTTEQLAEIEGQATQYTPPDGWRLLPIGEMLREGDVSVRADGYRCQTERVGGVVGANQRYIRRNEPQLADAIDELRSEVSYVQRLLGTERRRVAELEELVASLRTINAAQEKAVERANKETEKLALQWAAVKKELTTAAAVCQQLQIELDAAQQVPADSPELRRAWSDLAEVTRDRDEYRTAHGLLVQDANTVHERTQAMTAEAIIEWLYPFRGCNSPALALLLIESLPDIIRNIVGLDTEDVD